MRPATTSSARWRTGCAGACAETTCSCGWAATSSWCFCGTATGRRPWAPACRSSIPCAASRFPLGGTRLPDRRERRRAAFSGPRRSPWKSSWPMRTRPATPPSAAAARASSRWPARDGGPQAPVTLPCASPPGPWGIRPPRIQGHGMVRRAAQALEDVAVHARVGAGRGHDLVEQVGADATGAGKRYRAIRRGDAIAGPGGCCPLARPGRRASACAAVGANFGGSSTMASKRRPPCRKRRREGVHVGIEELRAGGVEAVEGRHASARVPAPVPTNRWRSPARLRPRAPRR